MSSLSQPAGTFAAEPAAREDDARPRQARGLRGEARRAQDRPQGEGKVSNVRGTRGRLGTLCAVVITGTMVLSVRCADILYR